MGAQLAFVMFLVSGFAAYAQSEDQSIKIIYASSPWNRDSTKVDSAYLFLRDAKSKKISKVILEETAPDSSTFSGQFSLDWAKSEDLKPEVYIPGQEMRTDVSLAKFYKEMNSGNLQKKPLVFRKETQEAYRIVDVYDTKEQAIQAEQSYQKELEAKKALSKPIPSESDLATEKLAEKERKKELQKIKAAQRESDRVRLEQLERQKELQRQKDQQSLAQAQREERQKKARSTAETALDFYRLGNFEKAEEFFERAIDLNPNNSQNYFKYAVSLYRNQKYDKALIYFNMAKVDGQEDLEKNYYLGLIHFRLKEYPEAMMHFEAAIKENHPLMSPSAAFYQGLIFFTDEDLEPAEKAFQTVLDTSQDPKLDQRAEEYIEKILKIKKFKKMQEQKWKLSLSTGLMFDSNILLATDTESLQGSTALDGDGTRLQMLGGVTYRPLFQEHHEFSVQYNGYYLYSLNQDEFGTADPFLNTVTLPYAYKSTLWGKGFKFTAAPGFETLFMDANDSGERTDIQDSPFLNLSTLFVMDPRWFSKYELRYRQDQSHLASSIGAEDADATKITLKTTQTLFRDQTKKSAIIINGGIINNHAVGDEKKYLRIELGVSYMGLLDHDASWLAGISAYNLNFPDNSDGRKDGNVTLTAVYSRPVKKWFSWSVTGSYTSNNSNVEEYTYSRYMILTSASFLWEM